jgi:hypothetical protein
VEEFLDLFVDLDRAGLAELAHWDGRQYRRFVDFLDRSLFNAQANASYVRITITVAGIEFLEAVRGHASRAQGHSGWRASLPARAHFRELGAPSPTHSSLFESLYRCCLRITRHSPKRCSEPRQAPILGRILPDRQGVEA